MKLKAVLLDIDNTLIFFDESKFFKQYFPRIKKYFIDLMPEEVFQQRILGTIKTLLENDGSLSNMAFFIKAFTKDYEDKTKELMGRFNDFYASEFDDFKKLTTTLPVIRKTIEALRKRNLLLVSASNPIWPEKVQIMRLEWAGIKRHYFDLIAHIENMHYCKPRVEFYQEICDMIDVQPEECLMAGNDPVNDMAPSAIGMKTYLTTDWIQQNDSTLTISRKIRNEHKGELPNQDYSGPFSGIAEIVKEFR